jgi:hypothetical protein
MPRLMPLLEPRDHAHRPKGGGRDHGYSQRWPSRGPCRLPVENKKRPPVFGASVLAVPPGFVRRMRGGPWERDNGRGRRSSLRACRWYPIGAGCDAFTTAGAGVALWSRGANGRALRIALRLEIVAGGRRTADGGGALRFCRNPVVPAPTGDRRADPTAGRWCTRG